jgi:CheY-like chemotaxis protein
VVDNEQAILDGMRALLEGWDMVVRTAKDGEEAAAALHRSPGPVRVILADYHLRRENGIDVIRALRMEARRTIPAVLITADRSQTAQVRAAAEGAVYIRKPVRPASLRAALSQLLVRAEAAE